MENYRIWARAANPNDTAPKTHSSTLFDTVAVYLAMSQEACQMETLGIQITDDGFTRIDPNGNKVRAAVSWKNLDAFRDLLTARLTGANFLERFNKFCGRTERGFFEFWQGATTEHIR